MSENLRGGFFFWLTLYIVHVVVVATFPKYQYALDEYNRQLAQVNDDDNDDDDGTMYWYRKYFRLSTI